jgi:hypothetical protein
MDPWLLVQQSWQQRPYSSSSSKDTWLPEANHLIKFIL